MNTNTKNLNCLILMSENFKIISLPRIEWRRRLNTFVLLCIYCTLGNVGALRKITLPDRLYRTPDSQKNVLCFLTTFRLDRKTNDTSFESLFKTGLESGIKTGKNFIHSVSILVRMKKYHFWLDPVFAHCG